MNILRTEDPRSAFKHSNAEHILKTLGPPRSLLTTSSKTRKSAALGVETRVLYLTSGIFCPAATMGCLVGCLGHSNGRMQLPSSAIARDRRAALYIVRPDLFMKRLHAELTIFTAYVEPQRELFDPSRETIPAVRLNGTSDIFWERNHPDLFAMHPTIQYYDYTKIQARMRSYLNSSTWPKNYHLTFSADSHTEAFDEQVLEAGGNVARVFSPELPYDWKGFKVIDGDKHDARFLDEPGTVIGLRAKGAAKHDQEGFVTRLAA